MRSAPDFIQGGQISRRLSSAIEPRLREIAQGIPLAAAFIGPGSDVLGYDTERSMDHDWGPRLMIVVPDEDVAGLNSRIDAAIDWLLPPYVSGIPTRFSSHADGSVFPDAKGSIHCLQVTSVPRLFQTHLDIENLDELTDSVWLSTPMQRLLELTSGSVFIDDTGELSELRKQVDFYPDSIWIYQLAALWMRVNHIQPFVGRAGEVGDDVGSATIAAAIVRDFMRIGLVQSRRYVPYAKWLGTASGLTFIGKEISPYLKQIVQADNWIDREASLNSAGSLLIEQLNGLSIVAPIEPSAIVFHSRPYSVVPAEQIATALQNELRGTELEQLPSFLGGIDMVSESTEALNSLQFGRAFRAMLNQ